MYTGSRCICNSGYYLRNGKCTICPDVSEASPDQSRCMCAANKIWNPTTFTCNLCPTKSSPDVNKLQCMCNPGYSNSNCVTPSTTLIWF
jgi:hypothetical protein